MSDWLTNELVVGALFVSAFSSVGMLALWAAASPRHWFVRTAVVLAVLAPLLAVPAHGLYLSFLLEAVIVACGIAVYRRWCKWRNRRLALRRGDESPPDTRQTPRWQFSVQTALSLVTLIAVLAAIFASVPPTVYSYMYDARQMVATFVAAASLVALFAAWVVHGQARFEVRVAAGLGLVMLLGAGAIVASQVEDTSIIDILIHRFGVPTEPDLSFAAIAASATFLVIVAALCVPKFAASCRTREKPGPARFFRAAAVGLVLFAAFPTIFVVAWLLWPVSYPDDGLPNPNGYNELVRIGKQFLSGPIENFMDANVDDPEKLAAAVAQSAADYVDLDRALQANPVIPVYNRLTKASDDYYVDAFHAIGHALAARARVARASGKTDEALDRSFEVVHLAKAVQQGGVFVHYLYGRSIKLSGVAELYHAIGLLDAAQCRSAIRRLTELESVPIDIEPILRRESAWSRIVFGWPTRVGMLVQEITGEGDSIEEMIDREYVPPDAALVRLLVVELALRAYKLEHGVAPEMLDALVPEYLPALPSDPFDPAGGPFRYDPIFDGGVLYSMGVDRDDDGGWPPLGESRMGFTGRFGNHGDLRLDHFFLRSKGAAAESDTTDNEDDTDKQPNTDATAAKPEK